MRTARSITSGENFGDFLILAPFSREGASSKSGAVHNCVLYDDVAFVANWPGIPVGNEEGELIAAALGKKRALLLSHHGLLIAGSTVEEACVLAIAFERAARMQLLANGAGEIKPIDPSLGAEAHDWVLRPKRNTVAFEYYARRSLKNPRNADCLRALA